MADEAVDVSIPVEAPNPDRIEVVIDKGEIPVVQKTEKVDPVITATEQPKIITADEGVEDLKAQVARAQAESAKRLNEFNRRIQEASDAARRAEERANAAELEATTVKKGAVETVLENINRDKQDAKRELKAAMEAADWDKVAEAQERLSDASAKLAQVQRDRFELEERAKNPPVRETPKPAPQLALDDPVEQFAASLTPQSADWVRSHPEFIRDQRLNRKMVRAHEDALDEGHSADSRGYFEYVNERLGLVKKEPMAQVREVAQTREVSRAPASAPVTREAPATSGSTNAKPGVVHLTASEVATAKAMDMSLQDYAKYKVQLTAEGKIGRIAS